MYVREWFSRKMNASVASYADHLTSERFKMLWFVKISAVKLKLLTQIFLIYVIFIDQGCSTSSHFSHRKMKDLQLENKEML